MNAKLLTKLAALLAVAVMLAAPAPAQADGGPNLTLKQALSAPRCEGVTPLTPANPAFIAYDEEVIYRWSNEPEGTAARALMFFDVSPTEGQIMPWLGSFGWLGHTATFPAGAGQAAVTLHVFSEWPGSYYWLALFFDEDGHVLCRSDAYWLDVRYRPGVSAPPVPRAYVDFSLSEVGYSHRVYDNGMDFALFHDSHGEIYIYTVPPEGEDWQWAGGVSGYDLDGRHPVGVALQEWVYGAHTWRLYHRGGGSYQINHYQNGQLREEVILGIFP